MSLSAAAGSVISAGIGALGSLFGTGVNSREAQKDREFQERMYKQQYQDSIDFWKMQNEYNLPSAQLDRLKQAGLNPLLMYGDGGISGNIAQGAPQLPSAPHGAQARADLSAMIPLANLALVKAQAKAMDAQANRDNAQAGLTESQTEGQSISNWINDQTKNVQIALKYGDYDYVKQMIAESANRVFQSSFVNASEMASLALQNSLAIRKQNLNEYEVGNNVMQGWQAVINGRISANAQLKNAFAAMMDATTKAKIAPYQIGVMRETASKLSEENKFLKESRSYRVNQEFQKASLLRKDVTWYDLLKESGISEQQSRTFLNRINAEYTNTLNEYKPIDEFMSPINMLTGFGAGMMLQGNPGRTQVKGFGR